MLFMRRVLCVATCPLLTCGDTQALSNSGQRMIILLASKHIQTVLLRPLIPHMVRRRKACAPIDARTSSERGACQYVDS